MAANDLLLLTTRTMHARAISSSNFTAVPKAFFRAFRVPAYALTAGGGAFAYASYKVDEFRGFMGDKLAVVGQNASEAFDSLATASGQAWAQAQSGWSRFSESASDFYKDVEGRVASATSGSGSKGDGNGGSSNSSSGTDDGARGGGGNGGEGPGVGAAAIAASILGQDEEKQQGFTPGSSSEELMMLTRKLIEVRNILKSIEHDSDDLTLPSLVVIGSQSSGKSSVLEAIVGHEFLPKGNNMVTRRPIELTLIHTTPTAGASSKQIEYAEFPGLGIGRMTDFSQVQKTLYDLNMAVPPEECVSDSPIELKIHSPHVPDLTMIDLPGYVQLASMDQPEELREKISSLCEKYIQEPNVILAVCAADVDLANSPALRASRKVDPLGLRTIGVITKMDLVEPSVGAAMLTNNKYPLALGYVGVVCKNKHKPGFFQSSSGHEGVDGVREGNVTVAALRDEADYFASNREHFRAPTRGRNAGVEPMTGTDTLRRRLMSVLEENMGSSLHTISNAVQRELEEASYQFKVQYNDRAISPESYVAETMDALKMRFNEFASHFGKPEVRQLLKHALDEKVLDILAQMYWTDPKPKRDELARLTDDKKLTAEELDKYWQHKVEASSSALTKSGIGRQSTQIVVDAIRRQVEALAEAEPFNHHPDAAVRIAGFSAAILRDRFGLTADQVENCVKPFKYEVEVEGPEWEAGRQRSVVLVQRELDMCNEALARIKKAVGGRRLRAAVDYVEELDRRRAAAKEQARQRLAAHAASTGEAVVPANTSSQDDEDPLRPEYNSAMIQKAREAMFLSERSSVLSWRINALKSRRCQSGPEQKAFCPEAFLNVVSEKLTYTAVMFINIELLAEFFYAFPREIDRELVYDLDKAIFARENPAVRRHLELQERKEKLEAVMERLDALSNVYADRGGGSGADKGGKKKGWNLF